MNFQASGLVRVILTLLLLSPLVGLILPASARRPINRHLFNLSMNGGVIADWHAEPWPAVSFGGIRLWDTGTNWFEINPAQGAYDWTKLDRWLTAAGDNHNDSVLYTFGGVPQWASSNPHDPICIPQPGACDPPDDLNADGSGPDQHWKDFVTALAQHSKDSSGAHIRYWEVWNEPHNNFYWNGTYAQLVRMVADAYAIIKMFDPDAVVLSVSVGWSSKPSMKWFEGYVAAGGGKYIDKISSHGYVKQSGGKYGPPENLVRYIGPYRASLAKLGLGSKEIWNTEANWGPDLLKDPDMQAGWLARFYILHVSESISRQYWFIWNGGPIGLWKPNPHDHSKPGKLLKAGIAYRELTKWLIGATLASRCSHAGAVWSCPFVRSGGYQALAVWDTSDDCHHGRCSTTQYRVDSKYLGYRRLDGKKVKIEGKTVPIGAKPILVENQL